MAPHTSKQKDSNKSTFAHLVNSIRPFDGDPEYLEEFFSEFIEITEIAEFSEREKIAILKTKLKDEAKKFLSSSPELKNVADIQVIFEEFKKFFIQPKSIHERQSDFQAIKLRDNETVRSLALRINIAASAISKESDNNPLLDDFKLAKLIDAVPLKFQRDILLKKPNSFNQAMEILENIQNVEEKIEQRVNAI